jgi:hypothetical protein
MGRGAVRPGPPQPEPDPAVREHVHHGNRLGRTNTRWKKTRSLDALKEKGLKKR